MPLTAITPDVDEWTQQLAASGASASVINQRLAGIGSWYRYLRLGVATTDPVSDAWRPEPADTDESETPFLTIAENGRVLRQAMKEIQDAADNPLRRERALRFAALVWLLSTTGIRSGAVLAAWVGDLRHNGGHQYLRHQLKGHADPVLDLLPAQVTTIIAEYHACRAGRLGLEVLDPEAPLLATISSRGDVGERAPDGEAEKKALRKLAARAGIGNAAELTLHSLRHTAASGAHNELDIPLDAVRRHLRHKSIVTTQKYVHPHLKTGTSVAEQLAVAYSAEIVAPGAGTLARAHHPIDGMTTQAALAAHAKVDALRKLAATEHGLGPAGVAEVAATMAAVIDRCDAADAAFGPLAEAIRAVIAGGMPSIDVS
jgi:integrase